MSTKLSPPFEGGASRP